MPLKDINECSSLFAESLVSGIPHGVAATPAAVLYAAGGIPYSFQNGLSMLQHTPSSANASNIPDAYTLAALPQMVGLTMFMLLLINCLSMFYVKLVNLGLID